MRQWATGVTLVTASSGRVHHGMTVSSFTSVSLSPPLILVSLSNDARTREMITQSQRFAVSVLAEDQQELADRFAGRIADSADRFEGVQHRLSGLGNPIPDGCLATLDCQVAEIFEAGNHSILIGQVENLEVGRDAPPLLYYDRDYRKLEE
jgi:flavin reductase (DIM6/NTAB) family NADH-FMN oxidoreductase RutF